MCVSPLCTSQDEGLGSLIPLGEKWGATCCDADPGFPKTRTVTCPRQPQRPRSLLFLPISCIPSPLHIQLSSPTEVKGTFGRSGTSALGQSCSRRLGSVFWALTSIRSVWSGPCGQHRWAEAQLLSCFPGMPELHWRGCQGSLFSQKSVEFWNLWLGLGSLWDEEPLLNLAGGGLGGGDSKVRTQVMIPFSLEICFQRLSALPGKSSSSGFAGRDHPEGCGDVGASPG